MESNINEKMHKASTPNQPPTGVGVANNDVAVNVLDYQTIIHLEQGWGSRP